MVTCIDTRHFLSTGTVMHYLYHIRSHRSVNDHKVRTILILHLVHCQRVGGGRGGVTGTSGSDTKMIVQYGHGRCRFDVNTFLNLSSPDYFFRCLDVCTITAVADVPRRFSLWKLSLPRLVSLNRSKRPGFWTEHSCQEVA